MFGIPALEAQSALSYAIALGVPTLDAVFPVLPSESAIVALGVATAGSTDPRLVLLVLAAAAGAFLGDNLSYLLGRYFGPPVERDPVAVMRDLAEGAITPRTARTVYGLAG